MSKIWNILTTFTRFLVGSLIFIYASAALLMYFSKEMRNTMIFLHVVNVPLFANFSRPQDYGLENTDNLLLKGSDGKLGAWYIKSSANIEDKSKASILYLHGNGGSRATSHRVGLLKTFSDFGYHSLALDYRGFADSDGYPTEKGVIEDSNRAWELLEENSPKSSALYIWGHSLGSAVAIQLAKTLSDKGSPPAGVILEAPFNNLEDGIRNHILSKPYIFLPKFDDIFIQELKDMFRSDYWIKDVKCPIMLLHDKSDAVIPIELAEKLCKSAKNYSLDIKCNYLDEQLGHKYIFHASNFKSILTSFITKVNANGKS